MLISLQMASYPEINIVREMFHSSSSHSAQDDRRSVLVAVQESLLKRVFRTFFEEDLTAAIRELQTSDSNLTKTLAGYSLRLVDLGNTVKYFWRPHLKDHATACGARFSQTRDWQRSPIRVIRWHPNTTTFKLAVAASDDCVRIYSDGTGIIPQLKCGQQKGVTSLAWRPFSAGELAVGCQNGIIIWSLQMQSTLSRPFNNSQVLKVGNHYPVSSVEWNSNGCEYKGGLGVDENKIIHLSPSSPPGLGQFERSRSDHLGRGLRETHSGETRRPPLFAGQMVSG